MRRGGKRIAISIAAGLAPLALVAATIRWPDVVGFTVAVLASGVCCWTFGAIAYDVLGDE